MNKKNKTGNQAENSGKKTATGPESIFFIIFAAFLILMIYGIVFNITNTEAWYKLTNIGETITWDTLKKAIVSGDTAKAELILEEFPELVHQQEIIQQGRSVTNTGITALHYAVAAGNSELVRLLLRNGANVHAREIKTNRTPIHWVVKAPENTVEITRILISAKADAYVKDHTGATMVELAKRNDRKELVEMMTEYEAFFRRKRDGEKTQAPQAKR